MRKILATLMLGVFCMIGYSSPVSAFGSLSTFKMCIFSERKTVDGLQKWVIYYTQDLPRSQSCPTPPSPAVMVKDHIEFIDVPYDYSVGSTDYYKGKTSEGEDCVVKRSSITIAD